MQAVSFFDILEYMAFSENIKNTIFHTAIIGGGASGLMCAGSFAEQKIIIERNAKLALKVSISGGGKCNFSNRFVNAKDYVSENKHFCKNALNAFKPQDFIRLLDDKKIPWEERQNGQLFAYRAQDIVRFLTERAKQAQTTFLTDTMALDVRQENGLFYIETSAGTIKARHLVLASGGLSYPSLGAGGFGIKTAVKLGHTIITQRPVLAGLTLPKPLRERFSRLAGNSLTAEVSVGKTKEKGQLLFTHDGFSGPAVLQASLYWLENQAVDINFLPNQNALDIFKKNKDSKLTFLQTLQPFFSGKILQTLLGDLNKELANASREDMEKAALQIHRFHFTPVSTSGYTKAEATAGGVNTREIFPNTFKSRLTDKLYITGELLDVTGRVGGFNLHWAFASGFVAGKDLEKSF